MLAVRVVVGIVFGRARCARSPRSN